MEPNPKQQHLLKKLPGVDRLLELAVLEPGLSGKPRSVLVDAIRKVIQEARDHILRHPDELEAESLTTGALVASAREEVERKTALRLARTVNATGVVVHTNLGRSLLAPGAIRHLLAVAGSYSNLEYNLARGARGSRHDVVESILCELSGAEAALAVNNNAGAVLLCLETLARGRQVIVSRGELVEIGGAFRIPDVMAKSGALLKEVGTTNRTHPFDYENAIDDSTALLLKVHTSNYNVVGFTASVSLKELVALGKRRQVPVMEDLGSGTLIDFSTYGLQKEPTVKESIAAGAHVVTFSGDKLLGGPQAGIILGRREMIRRIRQNPLARALRIDKLTLAALESTLHLYRDERKAVETIPTLRMLTLPLEVIEQKARLLAAKLKELGEQELSVQLLDLSSRAGGGSLPLLELPSKCVGIRIRNLTANAVESAMRGNTPPIIGRIEADLFVMDPRTLKEDEVEIITRAVANIMKKA